MGNGSRLNLETFQQRSLSFCVVHGLFPQPLSQFRVAIESVVSERWKMEKEGQI